MKTIAEQIEDLPLCPGVYFFYGEDSRLLYIGKSINIKKRVLQHFSGKDRKSDKIQRTTSQIKYEITGSELIALLHESDLIKIHQPIYNRAQRRTIFQYGLYLEDYEGYNALRISKTRDNEEAIASFTSMMEAKNTLFRITEKYRLCQKVNDLYKTNGSCFQYQVKECLGACISKEIPTTYNERVQTFLDSHSLQKHTQLLQLAGRTIDEKAFVYIENGIYKGFGFCSNETPEFDFLKYIEPKTDHKDARRILIRYLISI